MAEESLISSSWYRVGELRPQLRSHARIHRHVYRGDDWYVLQDESNGKFHRFSPEAYYLIGLMDGRRTLSTIWAAACERLGDDVPTQDEVIGLIGQLYRADVLQSDARPDFADMEERSRTLRRQQWIGYIRSPMAIRFPLLDPERFLQRTEWIARWVFGWPGALLWIVCVGVALGQAALHWPELTDNVADQALSAQNLLLIGLIYPLVKVVHEFGHAYAVKRWGGEVHEMGVMLLVFVPIPYVDASAATALPEKGKRVLVDAAGILVELFLASIALFVWLMIEPGLVRAIAFNVMLIASVSTVLFNGNPLLRFDAYYILADWLEMPNLGQRANRYFGYVFQRYLMGVEDVESPAQAPGERAWLASYAVASAIYRVFVIIAIVIIAASRFFFLGVVIAIWTMIGVVGMPVVSGLKALSNQPALARRRKRALAIIGGGLGVFLAFILTVPVPLFTVVEGVVQPPKGSHVRAGADGIVDSVFVTSGTLVRAGDRLMQTGNEELTARARRLRGQLKELEARLLWAETRNPSEAEIVREEVEKIDGELQLSEREVRDLTIRSPGDGVFLVWQSQDLPGRYIVRGTQLGYVVDFSQVTIQAVVSQDEVSLVRHHTRAAEARFADRIDQILPATLVREIPAASQNLPSYALSLQGGGSVALDPRSEQTPQSFDPHFQFELRADGGRDERIGGRVYVRFEHEPEPVGYRWYRSARRLLLSQFGV